MRDNFVATLKDTLFSINLNGKNSLKININTPFLGYSNYFISTTLGICITNAASDNWRENVVSYKAETSDWLFVQAAKALHRCGAEFENNMHGIVSCLWQVTDESYCQESIEWFDTLDILYKGDHPSSMRYALERTIVTCCIKELLDRTNETPEAIVKLAERIVQEMGHSYTRCSTLPVALDPGFYSGLYAPFSEAECDQLLQDQRLITYIERVLGRSPKHSHINSQWRLIYA